MNIDEIKQEKLQELMDKQQGAVQEELLLQKQIKILEENVKKHMTKEAFTRYANLKLAHQKLAIQALVLVNQAIETGKISQINDYDFKDLLIRIQNKKPEFKITQK